MKKLLYGFILISGLSYSQVGINTSAPHPSSALELFADDKGLLVPKIALTNTRDKTTILNPAEGLVVYNTNTAGTSPLNVVAGRHYFWNGTDWISLPGTQVISQLVAPKFYYVNSSSTQTFTSSQYGSTDDVILTFPTANTTIVNPDNLITFNSSTNIFTVNVKGTYELSAYINYNPQGNEDRALFNLKIQKQPVGSSSWIPVSGARGNWGEGSTSIIKTITHPITAVALQQGDKFRLVVNNPYPDGDSEHGGNGTLPSISVSANSPFSKMLRVRLIDYDY